MCADGVLMYVAAGGYEPGHGKEMTGGRSAAERGGRTHEESRKKLLALSRWTTAHRTADEERGLPSSAAPLPGCGTGEAPPWQTVGRTVPAPRCEWPRVRVREAERNEKGHAVTPFIRHANSTGVCAACRAKARTAKVPPQRGRSSQVRLVKRGKGHRLTLITPGTQGTRSCQDAWKTPSFSKGRQTQRGVALWKKPNQEAIKVQEPPKR